MDQTTPADNAAYLRAALLERMLTASAERLPDGSAQRVLDVGCGRGDLLAAFRVAGLAACGVEASPDRAAVVREAGDAVAVSSAEQLPFADGAVPWVVMRHVAHHLASAERGVRELARVASRGVVVAEPWRPQDRPEQRTALAIDLWCKGHHRRQGHEHHPDVPAEQLVAWLRSSALFGGSERGRGHHEAGHDERGAMEIVVSEVIRPACMPRAIVEADLRAAVADLPLEHAEVHRVDEWLALADETGVGATGTAIVVACRP